MEFGVRCDRYVAAVVSPVAHIAARKISGIYITRRRAYNKWRKLITPYGAWQLIENNKIERTLLQLVYTIYLYKCSILNFIFFPSSYRYTLPAWHFTFDSGLGTRIVRCDIGAND